MSGKKRKVKKLPEPRRVWMIKPFSRIKEDGRIYKREKEKRDYE